MRERKIEESEWNMLKILNAFVEAMVTVRILLLVQCIITIKRHRRHICIIFLIIETSIILHQWWQKAKCQKF